MAFLAPFYYKNLLTDNLIIDKPIYYKDIFLDGEFYYESLVKLKEELHPSWLSISAIYSNCDGTGTSKYKNIAVYKGISEALERWAFFVCLDSSPKEYHFTENPSSTGIAAYPEFYIKHAREKAILEARERWAVHEFWRGNLPIVKMPSKYSNLDYYQIVNPFNNCIVSLLCYKNKDGKYIYSFAAEEASESSFTHAIFELSRNNRIIKNSKDLDWSQFSDIADKRVVYFSTQEGHKLFMEKISMAPKKIITKPIIICDLELKGQWTKYAKVWRFLYDNSFEASQEHNFFMF